MEVSAPFGQILESLQNREEESFGRLPARYSPASGFLSGDSAAPGK
ncbi:hypothetical protein [Neglectibacter timonensis]|jgi:hypothetical protein|nr:hypothetical protein [Neglectibacter timonensis]MCQ4843026.1 hypothetical protein [Neglectibacter timonensis]MEE0731085.1 hypothetical protein [Oscillospiraceae bacterium]